MNMGPHYRIWSVLLHTFLSLVSVAVGIPDNLIHSSDVTGKITFRQMEGNYTYLRDSGALASCVPTLVTFDLLDLRHNFRSAVFKYTWDFGNGEVFEGPEPFVQCSYTTPGNYTFKLRIGANITKQSRITGLYTIDLTVLDAIQSIELRGPLSYNVDQSSSLSFHVGGSPPVWYCWRVLPDCQSPSPMSCESVRLYENIFNLSYTFTSVGTYCLEISVRNNISKLQTSYNIHVQDSPVNHLIFILPCAAVIFATLIFISVSVCCPLQESGFVCNTLESDMSYDAVTDIEMHAKDAASPLKDNCPLQTSSRRNESQSLLHQQGMYSQPC
ncbi:transmembrane protein 130 isoform X2 [Triplophysa rosa]|uniref:transmembrane protein 130 isoform X2 n=1 Tax=Triplophysa rosa TaxID=992332 RepID=UPI002545BF22|nr:transmembrane protein 130 isoform X2 [Triplophysa rosa]